MIFDEVLFERLEQVGTELRPDQADALAPIVARAIELKADVVERDERETGERMLLNYGHTVGHALEAVAGYGTLLHGEAVAVGMHAAALIAHGMHVLSTTDARRQSELLRRLRLPSHFEAQPRDVLERLSLDKKRAGSRQRWILAERVGAGVIRDDVPLALVEQTVVSITSA